MTRATRRLASWLLGASVLLIAGGAARPILELADLASPTSPEIRARLDAAVAGIRGGAAIVWTDQLVEPSSFVHTAIRGRFLANPQATGAVFDVANSGDDPDFSVDCPVVAALSPDRVVVAWSSTRFGGRDVSFRRFQKTGLDGAPLGLAEDAEAQDDNVDDCPALASVATVNASAFALAWRESALADGSGERIEARLFDGDGAPTSASVPVAIAGGGQRLGGKVAAALDRNRRLSVAYLVRESATAAIGDLLVRRFDRTGRPAGAAVRAGRRATGAFTLATLPGGGFALVWATPRASGVGLEIRRFGADGRPIGPVRRLSDAVRFDEPRLAADPSGALLVWRDAGGLRGLALDPDLRPSGARFAIGPIVAPTGGSNGGAGVAFLAPRSTLVAWPTASPPAPNPIRGRIYRLEP